MKVKLDEICKRIYAGGDVPKDRYSEVKTLEYPIPIYANAEKDDGLYGYTDTARENELSITVAARGTIGFTAIRRKPFLPVVRLITVVPDLSKVSERYLYYALKNCKPASSGTSIPQLTVPDIKKNEIELYSLSVQDKIADKLDAVERIIELRKHQLQKLDELVKARFIEMFGDPVTNPHGFEKVTLSDLAEIKIGPFGSLLHKEDYIEGGHALVNPSHIIDGKVSVDENLTVSDDKFAELSAYHLQVGDVVMGRRGEMGRCAVVLDDGLLCGTGSLLIRTKGEVTADYIQKIISFPSFKKTIEDMAVGQTMPNLNVPIVSGFQIIKPPMEVQSAYYKFVEQLDKSKVAIQKASDEAQLLFDSLMQKYFG